MTRTDAFVEHVYRHIVDELSSGGSASAVHQLWILYRSSPGGWSQLKASLDRRDITPQQRLLLDQLLTLSQLQTLEEVATRIDSIPNSLHSSFR